MEQCRELMENREWGDRQSWEGARPHWDREFWQSLSRDLTTARRTGDWYRDITLVYGCHTQ